MNCENIILSTSLFDDTLSASEVAGKIEKMRQHKAIKKKYENQIKTRKDGRQYYVIINRKQITATSMDALYQKLWEKEYGRLNSSISDLYPEWMNWKKNYTAVTTKTLKEYTNIWKKYLEDEELCYAPMNELKVLDFINLFRKLTKGRTLTKKAFANIKSLLNGIYSYAIEQGIVEHNPILDVNCKQFAFKPVNSKNDVFTIEERAHLLEHLKEQKDIYSLAIQLDFHLVLRIGELLALRWSDIEGDFIHVQNQYVKEVKMNDDLTFEPRSYVTIDRIKGNSDCGYRYQPITPECKRILEEIRKINPDGEYILMQNGKQLLCDTFNEHLHRHCKAIGIPPRSSHKIRFTVASILYAKGVALTSLQKLLGHTTVAMTMHYLRQVTPMEDTVEIMVGALG